MCLSHNPQCDGAFPDPSVGSVVFAMRIDELLI